MKKLVLNIDAKEMMTFANALRDYYGGRPEGLQDDEWILMCLRRFLLDASRKADRRIEARQARKTAKDKMQELGDSVSWTAST